MSLICVINGYMLIINQNAIEVSMHVSGQSHDHHDDEQEFARQLDYWDFMFAFSHIHLEILPSELFSTNQNISGPISVHWERRRRELRLDWKGWLLIDGLVSLHEITITFSRCSAYDDAIFKKTNLFMQNMQRCKVRWTSWPTFVFYDGKSCGTLRPHCLFIDGQSIILGTFFPKFHCWLYCRRLIYKYDHVEPSGLTMMAAMNNNEQFFFFFLSVWQNGYCEIHLCHAVMV